MTVDDEFREARASAFESTRSGSATATQVPTSTSKDSEPTQTTSVGAAPSTAVGAISTIASSSSDTAASTELSVPLVTSTIASSFSDTAELTESAVPPPPAQSVNNSTSTAGARSLEEGFPGSSTASVALAQLIPFSDHPPDARTPSNLNSAGQESSNSGSTSQSASSGDCTDLLDFSMFTSEDMTFFQSLLESDANQTWQTPASWNQNTFSSDNDMANSYGNTSYLVLGGGYGGNQANYHSDGSSVGNAMYLGSLQSDLANEGAFSVSLTIQLIANLIFVVRLIFQPQSER